MKTVYFPIALVAALILSVGSAAFAAETTTAESKSDAAAALTLPVPPSATTSGIDIDKADVSSPAMMDRPPVGETAQEAVVNSTGQLIAIGVAILILAGLFFWGAKHYKTRTDGTVRPTRHDSKMYS